MASYVLRNAWLRFVVMLFDDDCYFSSSVPFLQIPESVGDFTQAESPIDNRYLTACHEVPQLGQILSVRSRQVGEGVSLPRPRIQVVHGTVPQKCVRNTLPARSSVLYRPAIEGLRCHPLPTSSTRAPEVTPN